MVAQKEGAYRVISQSKDVSKTYGAMNKPKDSRVYAPFRKIIDKKVTG